MLSHNVKTGISEYGAERETIPEGNIKITPDPIEYLYDAVDALALSILEIKGVI